METAIASIARAERNGPDTSAGAARSTAVQVIFVEDDDFFRLAVEAELTDEGFTVHSFADGEPMMQAVSAGLTADVVLLDWGLERTLGIDLICEMRERGLDWPVVFLTGRNSP